MPRGALSLHRRRLGPGPIGSPGSRLRSLGAWAWPLVSGPLRYREPSPSASFPRSSPTSRRTPCPCLLPWSPSYRPVPAPKLGATSHCGGLRRRLSHHSPSLRCRAGPPRALTLRCEPGARDPPELRRVRRVPLSLYAPLPLREGAWWRMTLRLRAPKGAQTPGRPDPERTLFAQGVDAVGCPRGPPGPWPAPGAPSRRRASLRKNAPPRWRAASAGFESWPPITAPKAVPRGCWSSARHRASSSSVRLCPAPLVILTTPWWRAGVRKARAPC